MDDRDDERDRRYMRRAIALAQAAANSGEVPVGALLVRGDTVLAEGHNATIATCDPTAHAEIVVLREAARCTGEVRVGGELYVTLEPCVMCMGALVQARIDGLVFATRDPKAGAAVSLYRVGEDRRLNHRFAIREGIERERAAALLREFFQARRLRRGE